MAYVGDPDFQHGSPETTGILVANLGTPEAPTPAAVRRYLAEFLWDPRVIEQPRWLWWLILHGVILRIRPARSARLYAKVWGAEGSPLLAHARRQAGALERILGERLGLPVPVVLAMRYGSPSVAAGLETLRNQGIRRLLVLPLYPQYSATTTGSTFDAVAQTLMQWRWLPELRFVNHYHDDPGYIQAIVASIREAWNRDGRGDRLLFSFHGLPRRYLLAGDPYHCECQKTARLVAETLELRPEQWAVSFQSRVGREEWLRPYTDELLQQWGREGLRRVDVICPGFSADCLETVEEIAQQNHELFLEAGGEHFQYIPALNDRADHMEALANIVLRHMQGWPEAAGEQRPAHREATLIRARALGAAR